MALKEEPAHWDPGALRPSRWLSRAGWWRADTTNPLDDQDAFDAFVVSLRTRLQPRMEHGLDERVQDEIANFARLLSNMPRATIYRNRVFFEMAFDLLAAGKPNLALVARLRLALSGAMERSVGLGRFIAFLFGRTPIQAVVCGIFSSFLLLFLAILLLDQAYAMLQMPDSALARLHPLAALIQQISAVDIIVLVVAAFIGAVVSVLARFRYFLESARLMPLLVYVTVATKPFVSIACASFIYAIMACGLVTLPGIDFESEGGVYIIWVIGFLAGFSERFVQDFVMQADRIVGVDGGAVDATAVPRESKNVR